MSTPAGNLDWFVGRQVRNPGGFSSRIKDGECVGWTVDERGNGLLVVKVPGVGIEQWTATSVEVRS